MTRLDQRLVEMGLAPSRARAQTMILEGRVSIDGAAALKPGRRVGADSMVALSGDDDPWVSRAAHKLLHALDTFDLHPSGPALDIGASTGGFTQVLLARGAAAVHAVDVGHGQMHARISADGRVTLYEGVNARDLASAGIPPVDWITCDVSFISLTKILPAVLPQGRPGATLVALIKPQFEVGPGGTVKGIVRDEALRDGARHAVRIAVETLGWQVTGETESPITGADGNREFLIAARNRG